MKKILKEKGVTNEVTIRMVLVKVGIPPSWVPEMPLWLKGGRLWAGMGCRAEAGIARGMIISMSRAERTWPLLLISAAESRACL